MKPQIIIFFFQACIRVNEEKYYDFDPFHVYGSYHELYYYNEIDCKHDTKIPGLKLQSKIVRNALGTVKEIKDISSTLQRKESEIKKESKERYKNFMDERYLDEIDHHLPNTPSSPKHVFSDCVSIESLKRVQSELTNQIKGFQDAESERFSKMEETLKNTQDAERERFTKMEETLRNSLGAERERFSKMEETLRNSLGAEKERFSKMEENLRNTQGFQDAERERFSKLEETLGNIQGSLDAERERFSNLEETLRTCIQDSLQKQLQCYIPGSNP